MNIVASFFDSEPFMPHGHCYFWTRGLILLHTISDLFIVAAYFSIPFTLVYFVRKRPDIEFDWMFVCFAVFIMACGSTHLMEVWNIWHANYWLSGAIKALTALASVPTAILLVQLVPRIMALPMPSELNRVNKALQAEIAERKKGEQKFRALLEAAPEAMVIVHRDGKIALVNSQAVRLFGWECDELLGKRIDVLVPERFREAYAEHGANFFTTPKVRAMDAGLDLYGMRKDGTEFPAEISLSPLETEEGLFVSSAIRDVTERKLAERMLQETNIELERASQAKDQFLASMSHELRTPLNSILGFTGTLLMGLAGPLLPKQKTQLETVRSSARHQLSFINDLLDLSTIEAGKVEMKVERLDCRQVLGEIAQTLRPMAESKGLSFVLRFPASDVALNSDRRAFTQIVINLANNAIKFTESGEVAIILKQDDGITKVTVNDTGIGIKPADQHKVFEAFARFHDRESHCQEGTGLGLYLSQKLAALIGGQIVFDSEEEKGSTFSLVIRA